MNSKNTKPSSHSHRMEGDRYVEERTRGTMVRQLGLDALAARALELANDRLSEEDAEKMTWTRMRPDYRWAIATTAAGELVAICSEGVGYVVTDDKPLELGLIGSWRETDTGQQFSGMTANYVTELAPGQLRELAETGEDVDLADFVRQFGDRLEANFSIWFDRING